MKNTIFSLFALATLLFTLPSCKKEATFEQQLFGGWTSTEVIAADNDVSQTETFTLDLQATNEFNLDIIKQLPFNGSFNVKHSGNWVADDAAQELTFTYSESGETSSWKVTTLTETSMTVETLQGGTQYVITFERN
ncbi:MAG: hypothetical protein R3A50_01185 [Saprospiraceae bacterium]